MQTNLLTFSQFIVQHNITAITLKRIARSDPESQARFVIDDEGKLHGATATYHLHDHIIKSGNLKGQIQGGVGYDKRTNSYKHEVTNDFGSNNAAQSTLNSINDAGCKKGIVF